MSFYWLGFSGDGQGRVWLHEFSVSVCRHGLDLADEINGSVQRGYRVIP
ncbi:hypothetical protein [Candidatus Nitrotoga fabula]|nr:hypothetical protein [Candidatus Nitrotoga fabula]